MHWFERAEVICNDPKLISALRRSSRLSTFLRSLSKASFEVQVIEESELNDHWLRRVLLLVDHAPYVYAESLFSRSHDAETERTLRSLGSRALGEVLLADNAFIDRKFNYANIPLKDCNLPEELLCQIHSQMLLARKCCVCYQKQPIELLEIFLPNFCERLQCLD